MVTGWRFACSQQYEFSTHQGLLPTDTAVSNLPIDHLLCTTEGLVLYPALPQGTTVDQRIYFTANEMWGWAQAWLASAWWKRQVSRGIWRGVSPGLGWRVGVAWSPHPVQTRVEPSSGCAFQQITKFQNGFHILNSLSSAEGRACWFDPLRWTGSKYLSDLYVVVMVMVLMVSTYRGSAQHQVF